jgi:hypothetical protein
VNRKKMGFAPMEYKFKMHSIGPRQIGIATTFRQALQPLLRGNRGYLEIAKKKGDPYGSPLCEGGEDRLPRQQNPTDFPGFPQCRY